MKRATGRVGLNILIWAGSAVLVGSGVLHFHLWGSEGYQQIPTIGPLFLAQAIVGVALGVATAVFRRLILVAAGAALAISSIGALLISIWWGLFGWQEGSSAPYVGLAFALEAMAAAFLGAAFVFLALPSLSQRRARPTPVLDPAQPLPSTPLPSSAVFVALGEKTRTSHPAGSQPSGTSSEWAN
jgi:hypothetical protein